jgi:GT2 family glycosyltransferase
VSIDVVIVNYRSAADVERCLECLGPWHRGLVWLVDNSEQAAEAQALAGMAAGRPWVRLTIAPRNLGFGAACNLAFAASRAPFVLLLNPDALIAPAEVDRLAGALALDPTLGAVSPTTYWNVERSFVLPPPTVPGPVPTTLPFLLSRSPALVCWRTRRQVLVERRRLVHASTRIVRSLAGAVLLLDRRAVEAAGGLFDPRYFMFYEDADLSRRLRRSGYRLALVGGASAVHTYRHKASKEAPMERSCHQYFEKNHPAFYRWTDRFARIGVPTSRAGARHWLEQAGSSPASAAEFNAAAGGAVLAFSPSPWMWPALLRPPGVAPRGFDEGEWDLLEPGGYAALIARGEAGRDARWMYFEKPATRSTG